VANATAQLDVSPALKKTSIDSKIALDMSLNVAVSMSGTIAVNEIVLPVLPDSFLLLENGGYLLQENGVDRIKLEVGI
jgi:hypothetical protein